MISFIIAPLDLFYYGRIFRVDPSFEVSSQKKRRGDRSGDLASHSMSPNFEITCTGRRTLRIFMLSLVVRKFPPSCISCIRTILKLYCRFQDSKKSYRLNIRIQSKKLFKFKMIPILLENLLYIKYYKYKMY